MSNEIRIQARPIGRSTEVIGYVGSHEVMSISGGPEDAWRVGMSSCLPVQFERAALYVECMNRVLARAREYGADGFTGNRRADPLAHDDRDDDEDDWTGSNLMGG